MSKRHSAFQGRREQEYADNDRDAIDPVVKATAAQMAGRKVKPIKSRRGGATGVPSAPLPDQSFKLPQTEGGLPEGPFGFGGNNSQAGTTPFQFAGQQSLSFPPAAQTPATQASSLSFSAASQPSSNPFGALGSGPQQTPATSSFFGGQSQQATAFGGGNQFQQQQPAVKASNPFASLAGSSVSQAPAFGHSQTQQTGSQPAAESTMSSSPFAFGGEKKPSAAPSFNSTSTSGFNFGGTQQTAASPFGFGNAEKPAASPFGFGSAQSSGQPTPPSQPAAASPFNFGSTSQSAPPKSPSQPATASPFSFGGPSQSAPPKSPLQSAAASPFNFGASSQPAAPKSPPQPTAASPFKFGTASQPEQPAQTSKAAVASPFSFGTPSQSAQPAQTPKATDSSPFKFNTSSQSAQPAQSAQTTKAPDASPFNFGTTSQSAQPLQTSKAPDASPFNFGTPKKPSNSDTPAAQTTSSASTPAAASGFNFAAASKPASANGTTTSNSGYASPFNVGAAQKFSAESATPKSSSSPAFNFAAAQKPAATPKPDTAPSVQPASAPSSNPASVFGFGASPKTGTDSMPATAAQSLPAPKPAAQPSSASVDSAKLKDADDEVVALLSELANLNQVYKDAIINAPVTSNMMSMSKWHYTKSMELSKRIKDAKKTRAQMLGVTGQESSLSVKRKAEPVESPAKKARTPQTNAFASLNSTPTPTPKPSGAGFNPSTSLSNNAGFEAVSSAKDNAAKDTSAPFSAFSASVPSTGSSQALTGLFAASTSAAPASKAPAAPVFKAPAGGNFLSAFSQKAKTVEEMEAERMKKAMDEDYDSDEESKETWIARYKKEEAERKAKEAEKVAGASVFAIPGSTNTAGAASQSVFASSKPTSAGSSTFSSRVGSPAPSTTGGRSVFDTPGAATPMGNIFGHVSPNTQDEPSDDDDHSEDEQTQANTESNAGGSVSPTRSVDGSVSEASASRGSGATTEASESTPKSNPLMSRISFGPPTSEEKVEAEASGTQTPKGRHAFFDFSAAANTAPPKSTFAGDQTYKEGTPIKFGSTTPATETKASASNPFASVSAAPKFSFTPATPGKSSPFGSSAPAKEAKPTTFGFLSAGPSAAGSVPPSEASSRAATPGTDGGASDQEGEGSDAQIDLARLSEEEKRDYDVLFHCDVAIAKELVDKEWKTVVRGPLWILRNKETQKTVVRMRSDSGRLLVNYNVLPKLEVSVVGNSKKQVSASHLKDGKVTPYFFTTKSSDIAQEFASVYNNNLPDA